MRSNIVMTSTIKRKINILFVLPNFDTGGSERLVIDIIKNMDKDRFSPSLAVFFSGEYEKEFIKLGVPFYVIHKDGLRSKVSVILYLKRILREQKIDIVNTHHTSPLIQGFLPFKILSKSILIHTEHTRLDYDKRISAKILFFEKLILKKADMVVGISKEVCEYFEKILMVPKNKIEMIRNGVDLTKFHMKNFDREAYRMKLGFKKDDLIVGTFANFRPQKNHVNLIRAITILNQSRLNKIKFIMCGSGPTEAYIKNISSELNIQDNVIFMGTRFDIPELMNILDAYCLPSDYEGLPLSVLEAMAAERPVIATNVSGNNEVVIHGETGLLIKPNSPEDLSVGIRELMENKDLRQRLGRNGYDRAREFSFEGMIKKYEELFSKMFEVKNRNG